MDNEFSGIADDYFVNINLQTTLALPESRETVLHFCETVQKAFPQMASFYQRQRGEFVLEGDRESGSYPWMELQQNQLLAGYFNPEHVDDAYDLHNWLLERSGAFLGISGLDVEALDVLMGFNLDYCGNRDEIVSRALLSGSPLGALALESDVRPIGCEPDLVIGLDPDCYLQGRIALETRGSSYQIRTGNYDDEPISIYFTIRSYPRPGELFHLQEAFEARKDTCEEYVRRLVVPHVIQPIVAAIAGTD